MKKYTGLGILFALFIILGSNCLAMTKVAQHKIANIAELSEIVIKHKLECPDSTTLLCSDIDKTIISYPTYVGSEQWFGDLISELEAKGVKDAISYMFLAALSVHDAMINLVQPTETDVAGVYKVIKMMGIPIIGLTSRTYILSELTGITRDQLLKPEIGVTFSQPWNQDFILNDKKDWIASYNAKEGIAYCSGPDKANPLLNLMKITNFSIPGYPNKIDTIIVIDDSVRHLDNIEAAFIKNNIDIKLIRVLYTNPKLAIPDLEKAKARVKKCVEFQANLVIQLQQSEERRKLISHLSSSAPASYYSYSDNGHENRRPKRPGSCPPLEEWPN